MQDIQKGNKYDGKVKKIVDFGIFVELFPHKDGLLHISKIPHSMQKNLAQEFPEGSRVQVEVLDYDAARGRISLRYLSK